MVAKKGRISATQAARVKLVTSQLADQDAIDLIVSKLHERPDIVGKLTSMLTSGFFDRKEEEEAGDKPLPRSHSRFSQLSNRLVEVMLQEMEPTKLTLCVLGQLRTPEKAHLLYYGTGTTPQARLPSSATTEASLTNAVVTQYNRLGRRLSQLELSDDGSVGRLGPGHRLLQLGQSGHYHHLQAHRSGGQSPPC